MFHSLSHWNQIIYVYTLNTFPPLSTTHPWSKNLNLNKIIPRSANWICDTVAHIHTHPHTHPNTHTQTHTRHDSNEPPLNKYLGWLCVWMCLCVCKAKKKLEGWTNGMRISTKLPFLAACRGKLAFRFKIIHLLALKHQRAVAFELGEQTEEAFMFVHIYMFR